MTVLNLLRALRRHPVVAIGLLVASLNAGIAVWLGVPTFHEADSSMVLLSPGTVVDGDGKAIRINPWDRAGDTPAQVLASTIATVANSPSFVDGLAGKGVTSATTVEVALSGGGVVLNLSTMNRSATAATSDLRTLIDEVQATIVARQRAVGAPANSLLRADLLTEPGPPLALTGNRVKLAGVTVVLGIIVSVLVILLVDARTARARRLLRRVQSWPNGRDPARTSNDVRDRSGEHPTASSEETVQIVRPPIADARAQR
jgi:hypothetical protein